MKRFKQLAELWEKWRDTSAETSEIDGISETQKGRLEAVAWAVDRCRADLEVAIAHETVDDLTGDVDWEERYDDLRDRMVTLVESFREPDTVRAGYYASNDRHDGFLDGFQSAAGDLEAELDSHDRYYEETMKL